MTMRTIFRMLLITMITTLVFSSCSDDIMDEIEDEKWIEDGDNDITDNSVAFYESEIQANWKELFKSGYIATATSTIDNLTRISGTEYKVKGSVSLEGKDYNLEGIFNPFSDKVTIKINGQESPYKGSFYVNECTDCSAGASVFFNARYDLNSLNYITFEVRFQSDF